MNIHQSLVSCIAMLLLVACSPMTTAEPVVSATATPVPAPTVTPRPVASPTIQPTASPTRVPATPTATAQPTVQPTRTNTPTPSSTASPTRTALPPTVRPTQIPTAQACIEYKDAAQFVGQTTCVMGSISSTAQSGSTYFINFSASRDSFYAVSFNLNQTTLPLSKGQCVKISGKIETFNARPQIVIRAASQVAPC